MANQEHLLSPTTYLGKEGFIKRWNYPLGLFTHVLGQLPQISEEKTRADVSWEIDRYWLQRRSPNAIKTLRYLSKTLQIAANVYPDLNRKGDVVLDKQQPSLNETISETIKRLQFLFLFTTKLPNAILSCISGGSMSYGRFFNVRGGVDSSDLDLILVYENGAETELNADTILPKDIGFDPEDSRLLNERLQKFAEMTKEGKAQVISQKCSIVSQDFDVSMHIMSRSTFYDLILYGVVADLKCGKDIDRRLLDYKPKPFKHQVMRQQDFYGDVHEFYADEQALNGGVTATEVISNIPAYAISSGHFVPGMYQNLISPRFEFEPFSATKISAAVMLYWSLMNDLQSEYKEKNPSASVLKSHIRYKIFSPRLKKEYE